MQVPTPLPSASRGALCLTLRRLLLLLLLPTLSCGPLSSVSRSPTPAVDGQATVVFCDLLDDGRRQCPGCGVDGVYRDTVIRRVTDVPVVGHPLRLQVRVPRYRCVTASCEREVFAHNTVALPGGDGPPPGAAPATSVAG